MDESLGEGELPVWPDNVDAVEIFSRTLTQWTYAGMGVPVGLRFEVVPVFLRARRIPVDRWQDVMDDLQVMEIAALKAMKGKG